MSRMLLGASVAFAFAWAATETSRAGEAPADDIPAADETAPKPTPPPVEEGTVRVEPAPEVELGAEMGPPVDEDEPIPGLWGVGDERQPEWVQGTIARDIAMRVKYVRAYYAEAIRALRARRYAIAIEACKKAQALDPENLSVQHLRYLAQRQQQAHRLKLEADRSFAMDVESLAQVDIESRFPEEGPSAPRPRLPLREEMPEPESARRMEELLNQSVSMNFVEADLEYVLQTLFKISNVNIIMDQSVVADKTLSLHVESVPLKEILEFIQRNYDDIDYTVTESAVLITSPEKPPLVPKSYPLSRGLVGQGDFQTGVRRSSGTGSNTGYGSNYGGQSLANTLNRGISNSGYGGRSSNRNTSSGMSGGGGGVSAGGETYLESALTWVESWEDEWPQGSQWYLDRQTNTLFVLTTPEMHKRMEEILNVIDVVPIQVLVRTKFIEILASDLKELGLQSMLYQKQTDTENIAIGDEQFGEGGSGFQLTYGTFLTEFSGITAALRALEHKKRTKVLSAPQIIAMQNTPATIDVSKSFSYASQYEATNTTVIADGGSSIPAPTAFIPSGFEDVNVGFYMEFVPSVGRDLKNIVLDLHARVDDVVGGTDRFQQIPIISTGSIDTSEMSEEDAAAAAAAAAAYGSSSNVSVQRPVIDSREFRTRLVVSDGGTVIIGGLLKNYNVDLDRKVPILGDIPLLGLLFRYKKKQVEQSNLIIVVQAQIVNPDGGRYVDSARATEEAPRFGIQSFGSSPKRNEWIRDLAPELERDIYGAGGNR